MYVFKIIFCVTSLLFAVPVTAGMLTVQANMVVKVIDNKQIPVVGAQVTGSFRDYPSNIEIKCITDGEGICVIKGDATKEGSLQVKKDGYYYSSLHFEFKGTNSILGHYEPYGATYEVVLSKKQNPVPMYAINGYSVKPPEYDKKVGFDLERHDWVTPYGEGVHDDFVFSCKYQYADYRNNTTECSLTFSNPHDGIQEYSFNKEKQSFFKWPYEAPENGYQHSLYKKKINFKGKLPEDNLKREINYIFRVRTKSDEKGQIVDARYGKILGEIIVDRGKLGLSYYFNPDGTRNLEFDPQQNLFKFSRDEFMNEVQRP